MRQFCGLLLGGTMCAAACFAQVDKPYPDVVQARDGYEARLAKIVEESSAQSTKWPEEYLGDLAKLMEAFRSSGNLEGVLAVGKETERFQKSRELTEQDVVTEPRRLRDLQVTVMEVPKKIELARCRAIDSLATRHCDAMKALEGELTRKGEVPGALQARAEAERVLQSRAVTAARFVLAATPKPPDVRTGLILSYGMEFTSNKRIEDSIGRENYGQINGKAKFLREGHRGGAYEFDERGCSLQPKNSHILPKSGWTISVWFKYPPTGEGAHFYVLAGSEEGDCHAVMNKADGRLGMFSSVKIRKTREVTIWLSEEERKRRGLPMNQTSVKRVEEFVVVEGFQDSGGSLKGLSDGWHHLALVSENGRQQFYLNGTKIGETKAARASLACIANNKEGNTPWGAVDDFFIYERALSPAEVAELHRVTGVP